MATFAVHGTFQAFIEAKDETEAIEKIYSQCGSVINVNVEDIEEE